VTRRELAFQTTLKNGLKDPPHVWWTWCVLVHLYICPKMITQLTTLGANALFVVKKIVLQHQSIPNSSSNILNEILHFQSPLHQSDATTNERNNNINATCSTSSRNPLEWNKTTYESSTKIQQQWRFFLEPKSPTPSNDFTQGLLTTHGWHIGNKCVCLKKGFYFQSLVVVAI
jgi:hypothetical protein